LQWLFNNKLLDTIQQCQQAIQVLRHETQLFTDFEGIKLGRINGKLSIIGLAPVNCDTLYIFDMVLVPFEQSGLKELFESNNIEKIMFDCRMDASALWHYHGQTRITPVVDLQLLDVLVRVSRLTQCRHNCNIYNTPELVHKLNGLSCCIEEEYNLGVTSKSKNFDYSQWHNRPLETIQLKYIEADFKCMKKLYNHFVQSGNLQKYNLSMLYEASEKYMQRIKNNQPPIINGIHFGINNLLPLGILDTITLPVEHPTQICSGCKATLSVQNHYSENNKKYCHVCCTIEIQKKNKRLYYNK
jgi:ribonuclease D